MSYIRKTFTFNGKRYEVKGKTEEEAIIKMLERKEELKQGLQRRKIICDEWFDEYIEMYKVNASEKTVKDYRSQYNNSIKPFIGGITLESVTPIRCQKVMNGLQGKSGSYVKKVYMLMNGMFNKAVANRLISYNPTADVIKPNADEGERRALTEEERIIVKETFKNMGHPGLFFLIIYHCGLRPSEVRKLKGKNINYENRTIHIYSGKTKSAVRDVFIPDELELPIIDNDEYLFKTCNKTMVGEKQIRRWWDKAKEIGEFTPDLVPYCLRHDFCTRLQEAEVPIDVARRIMGHSSIEMTSRIYTHSSNLTLKKAADLVNSFNGKK